VGAGFASVFRWNGEAGERNVVGLLERSCFTPSVHMVCVYSYEPNLIPYKRKYQVSQIDTSSQELNAGALADRVHCLEYLL
jgi:hypothetical protein